ncbi:hypothetical protein DFH11DRAFT_542560 [Phellopilus nigrolimitatus]|nr:hypothetical protein DFH11DRAFT_542560 [Phellopilus nigrolimitatus]
MSEHSESRISKARIKQAAPGRAVAIPQSIRNMHIVHAHMQQSMRVAVSIPVHSAEAKCIWRAYLHCICISVQRGTARPGHRRRSLSSQTATTEINKKGGGMRRAAACDQILSAETISSSGLRRKRGGWERRRERGERGGTPARPRTRRRSKAKEDKRAPKYPAHVRTRAPIQGRGPEVVAGRHQQLRGDEGITKHKTRARLAASLCCLLAPL